MNYTVYIVLQYNLLLLNINNKLNDYRQYVVVYVRNVAMGIMSFAREATHTHIQKVKGRRLINRRQFTVDRIKRKRYFPLICFSPAPTN